MQIILDEINPKIIVLTEHNIKEGELKYLKINGYDVSASFCRKSAVKGGVMILSSEGLAWRRVVLPTEYQLGEDRVFEYCATNYTINNFKFILVGVYRSPSSDPFIFLERLSILIGILLKKCKFLVIAGDININVMSNSKECLELNNMLKSHGMKYLVDFPTRVCSTTATCIDNFMTNISNSNTKVDGIISNLSDHDGQTLEILVDEIISKHNINITWHRRKFSDENKNRFLKMLSNEDWLNVYFSPVESKFDEFFNTFDYYFNLCFPKIKCRKKNQQNNGWITHTLHDLKYELRNLTKLSRSSPDPNFKFLLKDQKKHYHSKIKETKSVHYEKLIKGSDNVCKTTWNIIGHEINSKKKHKHKNISVFWEGAEINNPSLVGNILNNHYANLVDKSIIPNLQPFSDDFNLPTFSDKLFVPSTIEPKQLEKVIMSFENKYSTGYDDVPMAIIKFVKSQLIKPLVHLINSSIISGIFPDKLKIAKIKPLLKSNDSNDVSNYRPLSLLPTFSKIFERVMANQLTDFLENNNLLDKEQHGFRAGKSVISAGADFLESIVNSIDDGSKSVGIFMDLSKAFDSVSHKKLLCIMNSLGIKNNALSWFKSYLQNRKQFVEITYLNKLNQLINFNSKLKEIKYGVPQGSILGPILFLCYLKGLPGISNFDNITLYADDISVHVSCKSYEDIETVAFNQLATLKQALNNKLLILNPSKSKFISFTSSLKNKLTPRVNIFLDEDLLEEVNETKFLGLNIDKHLNWNNHVSTITKKLASGLYVLKQISKFSSLETMKTVYFAFIQSHITFGLSLYGSTSTENLNKLLIYQKKAIRIMLALKWNDTVKEHFAELGIMTVYSLYIFQLILFIKKNSANIATLGHGHNFNTRHKSDFAFCQHRLSFFEKKPSYAGIKYYNKLASDIKSIEKFKDFKRSLKDVLICRPLYSLDEFFQ